LGISILSRTGRKTPIPEAKPFSRRGSVLQIIKNHHMNFRKPSGRDKATKRHANPVAPNRSIRFLADIIRFFLSPFPKIFAPF
jgi:hypothetical protein